MSEENECVGCVDEFEEKAYFPCSQCSRNPNGFLDYFEPIPDDSEYDDEEDEEIDIS